MAAATGVQSIPVNFYRTPDLVTVAAPMPGLEAENILVEVTAAGRLVLRGQLRAALKEAKELLCEEWRAGPYQREIELPTAVDGEAATLTYGNGVLGSPSGRGLRSSASRRSASHAASGCRRTGRRRIATGAEHVAAARPPRMTGRPASQVRWIAPACLTRRTSRG